MAKKIVGGALRTFATFFYFLDFLCAAGILGIYSYFLAKLNIHHLAIINQWRAVEGIAGAAVIYTLFAVILTCFLGGISIFAFTGMILDLLFCGAMVAIAVLVREAAQTCSGTVVTPVGTGDVSAAGPAVLNYGTACKLNFTVLILACAGALFFLLSFLMQLLVARHHRKEKGFGPSPDNDYTSGSAQKKGGLFRRRTKTTKEAYNRKTDTELAPVGAATNGTTHVGHTLTDGYANQNTYDSAPNKYESHPAVPAPLPTTTHTGPTIVSSTTTTQPGYYDPEAKLDNVGGATGFAAPHSNYIQTQPHLDAKV